jgi:hypothetical protein
MRSGLIKIALIIFAPAIVFPASQGEPPAQAVRLDLVRRGMGPEDVRAHTGRPGAISRQILLRRHLEQWHFEDPQGFVEWNCQSGELPYVLSAQKLNGE